MSAGVMDDLGAAAAASQDDIAEYDERGDVAQPAMIDEGTKVKFVGVNYNDTSNVYKLGDEVTFIVRGRITGESKDIMADGHQRDTLKVKVDSVVPREQVE